MADTTYHRSTRATPKARQFSILDFLSLYRQRRALARLDDRALDDIGVTRAEAEKEAKSGFWNVPDHWLR
ncbi:MAG: DUF1127 domain-containing protein [Pseudomonadota bacterium]